MKSVIFLPDGMADLPIAELNGKTPLEYAATPAMDLIARNGVSGTFLSLPDGLPTSSDVANMSVMGYCPEENYPGRGPIEAASQKVPLAPDDVAFRCNLVTVSPEGILLDYSAGHIDNKVSSLLMKELQREFGSEKVSFYPGVSYRNLLVLHGKEFSSHVDYYKPDSSQGIPEAELSLCAKDFDAQHTVDFLNELGRKAALFLEKHPLNQGKASPANRIWPWSPGHKPALPQFSDVYAGKKGAIVSAVDVIKGIGYCSGMTVADVPGATGFIDTNYAGKVAAALKLLETHDFVYIHVEATDECSHMGDLKLKLRAIEDFDAKIVAPVLAALQNQEVRFAVLPDHPVPLAMRQHTTTPVPVALCGTGIVPDGIQAYSERLAPQGSLGNLRRDELMRKVLGLSK